jgi:hypothetical protein
MPVRAAYLLHRVGGLGLARTRWPDQEYVAHLLAALGGGVGGDPDLLGDAPLADQVAQGGRGHVVDLVALH